MLLSVISAALVGIVSALPPQDEAANPKQNIILVPLQNAVAGDLERQINELSSGSPRAQRITHDPRTNSLILHASEERLQQLRELIAQLDRSQEPTATPIKPGALFPPAKQALQLPAAIDDAGRITFKGLIERYAQITAQQVIFDASASARLAQMHFDTPSDLEVPAAAVQGFLERVLSSQDVILMPLGGTSPHVVSVVMGNSNGPRSPRERAYFVPESEQALLSQHPAVLFTTLVSVRNADANQISQSVRMAMTDNMLQYVAPVGNSVLLTGTGAWLSGMIKLLKTADAHAPMVSSAPSVRHELVALANVQAIEIAPLLKDAFVAAHRLRSSGGVQPNVPGMMPVAPTGLANVQCDLTHNALFITCDTRDWDEIRTLISALDRK